MTFQRLLQIASISLALIYADTRSLSAQDMPRPQPEIATGLNQQSTATGNDFMAVTANPHATKAAYDILSRGGNAIDAAIAAQLTLGLVEPQSSGLGGGAFALFYDAKEKRIYNYDGRETAPNLSGPFLFFENGKPINFKRAVIGGRSVGVPGVPALLSGMHESHGALTWMELFDTPIKLAEDGFVVSPRMAKMVKKNADDLAKHQTTASYFLPNNTPISAGQTLKNPDYAETLKEFRFYNAQPFYRGRIARSIVDTVQNYTSNPGLLSAYDFENYEVKKRPTLCGPYRKYIICSMNEPSSGGLTLLQALGMLEHFDISKNNAESWHIIAQASALAFADRAIYMADSDFVNTPNISLINPDYLKSRAALIDLNKPLETIEAGTPPDWDGEFYDRGLNFNQPGTSHISIIDIQGNIVSMTTSLDYSFGSHLMVDGFLLNNQLTDFSFNPLDEDRAFVANMVEPQKRPRSSMSPTIVFNAAGDSVLVLGSAGGSRIINHVLQRIIAVIDWNVPIGEAIAAPHVAARNAKIEVEEGALKPQLNAMGNEVEVREINSGLTAIQIKDNIITGTADPRREGLALGE